MGEPQPDHLALFRQPDPRPDPVGEDRPRNQSPPLPEDPLDFRKRFPLRRKGRRFF